MIEITFNGLHRFSFSYLGVLPAIGFAIALRITNTVRNENIIQVMTKRHQKFRTHNANGIIHRPISVTN